MMRILIMFAMIQIATAQTAFEVREIIGTEQSPLRRPAAIAVGMSGLVYISDTGNNRLVAVDSTGAIVLESSKGGSAGELRWPAGVTVGNGERVYVADAGNKRIVEFSRLLEWKGELSVQDETGVAVEPRLLAVDGVGELFAYESDNGQIVRYDSFYKIVARLGGQSGNMISTPASLAFSALYGVLWTSHRTGELFHCDAYLSQPRKLAVASDLKDVWQAAALDSMIYLLADSTLIRRNKERSESLQLDELGIAFVRSSDLRLAVTSSGQIHILDSRRGSLHRLYWP